MVFNKFNSIYKLILKLFLKKDSDKKMAQCKECEFYKPIDNVKGDCFGHEVPGNLDASKCPANSFKPRTTTKKKSKR